MSEDFDLDFLPQVNPDEPVDMTPRGLLPDGDYEFTIEESILEKNDYGKVQLVQKLKVDAPEEFSGRVLYRRISLQRDDMEQQKRVVSDLRRDFHLLGSEWGGGPDLKQRHKQLEGKRFKGRKKTGKNPKYFDVYVNGAVAAPVDDGVPF
jgi:hypothetical protein